MNKYQAIMLEEIQNNISYVNSRSDGKAKEVMESYWTQECDKKLKDLCNKWGIFAHHFFDFKNIIGTEKFERMIADIQTIEKFGSSTFYYYFIEYKNYQIVNNIPRIDTRCIFCEGKIDLTKFEGHSFEYMHQSLEINSLSEFIICRNCAEKYINKWKTQTKSKKKALKLLKGLYDLLGFIPPKNYYVLRLVKQIPKDKTKQFLRLIQKIPYPDFFKKNCGSWFETLIEAKILEEGTRKLSRGTMCKAKDGHTCLSMAECIIDDWLNQHNIEHTKEEFYPKDKDLNPKGLLRADWKTKTSYIEFFGLRGNPDYDIRIELKKDLCKKKQLELIEIYPEDLKDISKKIKIEDNI